MENGTKASLKVTDAKFGQTVAATRASGSKASQSVKASRLTKMAMLNAENGKAEFLLFLVTSNLAIT